MRVPSSGTSGWASQLRVITSFVEPRLELLTEWVMDVQLHEKIRTALERHADSASC